MRSRLALVIALGGCELAAVDRPIGLVPDDLPAGYDTVLAEAGACWNLQFGTQLVSGAEATRQDQQVRVFVDETTCLDAPAQTQAGWPEKLALCPERYWPALEPGIRPEFVTPFRVISHELGHVLNIVHHPDDPLAVMRSGGFELEPMFRDVDLDLFADANPDLVASTPCRRVVRSRRPDDPTIEHCACEIGPLDATRAIVLIGDARFGGSFDPALAIAAGCWNLRYGTGLAVRAPAPGEQRAFLDSCPTVIGGRVLDRDTVLACIGQHATASDAMFAIAHALGVGYMRTATAPFAASTDAAMANVYGARVQCGRVVADATGACTCGDPRPAP